MICHFFSGGILCDVAEDDCGHATSTNTGGAIFRTGHTFVLTHGTITPAIASTVLGFKLNFFQLPCNSADVSFTST